MTRTDSSKAAVLPQGKTSPAAPVRSRSGQVRAILLSVFLLVALVSATDSAPSERLHQANEYQVKALFLYNFAKFIDWPEATFESPREPFTLCIIGEDPFGKELERAVEGKTVNGRGFLIVRALNSTETKPCQIVFIGGSGRKQIRPILERFRTANVVTVGETEGFVQWGGTISFVLADDRVRFDINLAAADRAHLRISAKLLSLARTVLKRGGD